MKEIFARFRYELILSLLTLSFLLVLEWQHPYFFLQDDNRSYHLPYYVHNFRALLGGELPLFNFNQYLGTPVSFLSAPFYPINYLGLILSRFFAGHYFAAMEFIAFIHLTIAAIGFYRFSRSFVPDEASCLFGAVAWGGSPFVITIGNSWIHTLGFAAYLPWMLLYSIKQTGEFGFKDFTLLLFFRVLAILLGYPQWFLYMMLFEVILLVASLFKHTGNCGNWAGRLVFRYVSSYLALLVVSLPVLLQLFRESSLSFARNKVLSWDEYTLYSYLPGDWFNGLLTPFLDNGRHPFGELGFVSHIGYATVLCVITAICIGNKSRYRREVFIFGFLSLFSFLWSIDVIITKIIYYLPFFNKLRYPFKLQFFTGFFLILVATFGFSCFTAWLRGWCRRGASVAIGIILTLHALNFLALYTLLPQRMLSAHLDRPPFIEPLTEHMRSGRIVSAGPDVVWDGERVVPGNTVPTLGYNFAMLWDLKQFGGYEALLSERNFAASMGLVNNSIFNVPPNTALDFAADVPLGYLRQWGVSWYVVNSTIPLAGTEGLRLVHSDIYRNVLHDPGGKSLVHWADDRQSVAPEFRFRSNAVDIKTRREREGLLTISVLYHPFFRGYLDDKPVPVTETEAGQVSVVVPAGEHSLRLEYVDTPFQKGVLVSATFILSAVLLSGVVWSRKNNSATLKDSHDKVTNA